MILLETSGKDLIEYSGVPSLRQMRLGQILGCPHFMGSFVHGSAHQTIGMYHAYMIEEYRAPSGNYTIHNFMETHAELN